MVRGTWLATLVILASDLAIGLSGGVKDASRVGLVSYSLGVLVILPVTPPVWWWTVARHRSIEIGRGAAAGMITAALVPAIELGLLRAMPDPAHPDAFHDVFGVLIALGFAWATMVPAGAVIGALAAVLQRRWMPGAEPPQADSAGRAA